MPFDPYSQESQEIDQRRKYAEALREQSAQPLQTQMVGNRAIPINPLQGLSKMLQAYSGRKGVDDAGEAQKALAARLRGDTAAWSGQMPQGTPAHTIQPDEQGMGMTPMQQPAQQPTPQQYAQWLGGAPTPQAAAMGGSMVNMQQQSLERDGNRQFRAQESGAARQARMDELRFRIDSEERAGRRADDLKRELAREAERERDERQQAVFQQQETMRRLIQANRPPPAPEPLVSIQTPEGPRLVPRSQAVNKAPAMAADERRALRADESAVRRAEGAVSRAGLVISKIDEALGQTGPLSTGLTGAAIGMIPGTGAYDLGKTVDTIKANIGFQELQAMREASPTGGALGQVAVKELDMLQSVLANIDKNQSRPQLESNLKQARQHFSNWRDAMQRQAQGGEPGAPAPTPTPAPAAPQPARPTVKWGDLGR